MVPKVLLIKHIGAKPNLYCKAIELVCGGSPKACVLVERKVRHSLCPRKEESPAQSKVGAIAAKTSLDQLFVQYKCTVMDEINGNYLQLP